MAPSSFTVSFLVAIVCIAIWAPMSCFGDLLNPIPGFHLPGLPLGQPCLQAVLGVEGCIQQLVSSFLSLQPHIGPQCCKAVISIDESCWPKIFPFNPIFPAFIKGFCPRPNIPPTP